MCRLGTRILDTHYYESFRIPGPGVQLAMVFWVRHAAAWFSLIICTRLQTYQHSVLVAAAGFFYKTLVPLQAFLFGCCTLA